jgi:phosphotriesterase-related protein
MHEHVFVVDPEVAENFETGFDEDAEVAKAVTRLNELHAAGIGTIVDLTVTGIGRSIRRLLRAAAQSDLNIVVATGIYTFHDVPGYFAFRRTDEMAEHFVHDIEVGIASTGVRAGILKCATDEPGVTRGVEKVLRAVARAHVRTGAPISTHTHAPTRRGLEQQAIFREEGVDLTRVVIGHSGDSVDLDYLEALAHAGSYLGMDRFGLDSLLPENQRLDTVAELCRRGRADQMVLSHDAACYMDSYDAPMIERFAPNWHYLHITNDIVPALQARGVTDEQLHLMLVENPKRILESVTPASTR